MYDIVLIPGDGIGPEICNATLALLDAIGFRANWHSVEIGACAPSNRGIHISQETLDTITRAGIVLKGPMTTPVGTGHRSINVFFRQKFGLYANIRPIKAFDGISGPYAGRGIDLTIFRENTEDLYAGIEKQISEDECHGIKVITRQASTRIALAGFKYAHARGLQKVTVVHKANIMKLTDGLFLEACRRVGANYPHIALEEVIVDNMCMQLVMHPEKYGVIITENLYGDILSDLCAGLIGGLGLAPSANIGADMAIFEAVHGSAPDIAGRNIANPIALMLSAALMLEHLKEYTLATLVRSSIQDVLSNTPIRTPDLGGTSSTEAFTQAIIAQAASKH